MREVGVGRGFEAADHRRRAAALQRGMAEAGLDALLLTTEADVRYVTGFLTRFWESPTRPWFVVLPVAGEPVAVIPRIGAALMVETWVQDIRSWDSPDPADDGVTLLASTLGDLVPARGRVGLLMGPETQLRMPLLDFARVEAAIRPRTFADATAVVRWVREVKSAAEIAKIRAARGVAGRAFARFPEIVREGRPLDAVFRAFQILCLEEGADVVPYLARGAGPDGYADVISPATSRPLARGDVLMLDSGLIRDGYWCDFDRNVAIGAAADAMRRAHATLHAAAEAGLAAARPGVTAAQMHGVMQRAIKDSGGVAAGGRMGHGLGLQLTEWPSFVPNDRTVLREGMVLTLEPAVATGPGWLMVHEENFVIQADGAELLSTRKPAELPVL